MLENVFIRPEYIHSILPPYMDLLSSIWQHREHLLYDSSILLKATNSLLTKYILLFIYYYSTHLSINHKLLILRQMDAFFETPQSTIEIYINFDMVPKIPYKVLQGTCSALGSLIENSFTNRTDGDTEDSVYILLYN